MSLVGKTAGHVTYQDVKHITTDPNYPNRTYLSFNGSDTRGEIPISLKDKANWEIEITIASKETRSSSAIYSEPCIIGVDTGGYVSRDMHVGLMNGYLHLFSGLGGSNSVSSLPEGSVLNGGGGDYGYRTPKYISDGKPHTIKVYLKNNKLGLIADNEDLGYLTATNTLGNYSDIIYLGSSYPSARVYGQFDLFYLKVTVDDVIQGEYDLTTTNDAYIIDISGNSKNIPLYGTRSYGKTSDKIYIDYSLPEGIGGFTYAYATYNEHKGFDIRKLEVYFTYKQDDKINLWEGTDASISGITEALVNYRPHVGLDIRKLEPYTFYRPHDGLDIRKLDLYFLYKQEDKVDTFQIPYGIGGIIHAYIIQKLNTLVGYLNMYDTEKVQAIILGSDRYPLKDIQSFNDIPFFNNNTTDEGG